MSISETDCSGLSEVDSYIKPTMTIYEALRWIAFGLPPLKTSAMEDAYIYEDVFQRRTEDIRVPEGVTYNVFYSEEGLLKQVLMTGRLKAFGLKEAEDTGWGGYSKKAEEIPQTDWLEFVKWNTDQKLSRVVFWDDWVQFFYGGVHFTSSEVMKLFPKHNRPYRDCVLDENDIYQTFEAVSVSKEDVKPERAKPGPSPRVPKEEMYKAIAICALSGEIDLDASELSNGAVIADFLEKRGQLDVPKPESIGSGYLRELVNYAKTQKSGNSRSK